MAMRVAIEARLAAALPLAVVAVRAASRSFCSRARSAALCRSLPASAARHTAWAKKRASASTSADASMPPAASL
jgi:hypothetical protein